jgi:hypothetical protein
MKAQTKGRFAIMLAARSRPVLTVLCSRARRSMLFTASV